MGILDKLRPQSKSTHPDPNIRIEAIHELDPADLESLNAFAKDDTDARVRRVAVARIGDASVLADIVRNESEGSVRDHALGQLVEQASKHDAAVAMTAVAALASLGRERELATVAKAAGPDEVRRAAIAGVRDEKSLGSIARHAAEAGARLVALERLTDAAEIEGVALRGEHADAAVAAIDRLVESVDRDADRDRREGAHQGGAEEGAHAAEGERAGGGAGRERSGLQGRRSAEGARPGRADERRCRRSPTSRSCARRMRPAAWRGSSCSPTPTSSRPSKPISRTPRTWCASGSPPTKRRAPTPSASAARSSRNRPIAPRCARASKASRGDDITDGVAQARATWEGMPAMPEAWAAELDRRFAEACRAAEKRFERRQLAKQSAERLPTLVPEIEALAENPSYNDIRSQWYSLRKQWQAIARDVEIDAELRARYDAAAQKLEAQEQTHRDAKGQQQVENLQRLQALVQKFETRATAEGLTLKQTDQLMKDVKLAVGTMGPLPTKQDREDLMVRLQAVRTSLTPRIQELREAEEWKRWANVQVQEELCAKMEALIPLAETDPEKASNEMRTLQERWKPVAAAPRSQAETLWTRFKTAQEQVYDKCKDFFAQQADRARREPEEEGSAVRCAPSRWPSRPTG